jgi:WD40 repeat protein
MAGHDKKEGRPHVRIWNSLTLQTLKVIGTAVSVNEFSISISCLAFSRVDSGEHLAIVDEGNILSVWNWQQAQKVCSSKCHSDIVLAVEFHPTEKSVMVTCGKQHVNFWTFDPSLNPPQSLSKRMGIFELLPSATILNAQTNVISSPTLDDIRSTASKSPKFLLNIAFSSQGEVI